MKTLFWLIVSCSASGLLALVGCGDRATRIAIEAADRQAQQNQELARLNREHAEARKELINLHQQVQSERSLLSTGWNALHSERLIALAERRTESLFGQLVPVLLVAIAALFVWRMVSRWLDYRAAAKWSEQRATPITSAPVNELGQLPDQETFLPLTSGDPDESPRDDHDPGA